jgi:hypothetical protein
MRHGKITRAGVASVASALAVAAAVSMQPVVASAAEVTHATPAMLQPVSPEALSSHLKSAHDVPITKAQYDAYEALPASVRAHMGPPVDGKVLTVAELRKLAGGEYSTVMCPW